MQDNLRTSLLLILLFLCCALHTYAQQPITQPGAPTKGPADSTKRKLIAGGKTRVTTLDGMAESPRNRKLIDTTLDGLQQYDPGYLQNLGNNGTPAFSRLYDPFKLPGFDFGFHQWDLYRYRMNSLLWFDTQNPFTDLYYVQGSQELQWLRATHSQNIKPNWNFALQFFRGTSRLGFYPNQITSSYNFGINTWYRTLSQRYMVQACMIANHFEAQENGGSESDSLFEASSALDRLRLPVRLQAARQLWDDYDLLLRQYVFFGPHTSYKPKDTSVKELRLLTPRVFLSHTISFSQDRYNYLDGPEDTTFYRTTYNKYFTHDRYLHNSFSNEAGVGYQQDFARDTSRHDSFPSASLFIKGYARYDYIRLKEDSISRNFDNASIGGRLRKNGRQGIEADGQYYLSGYSQGDFMLDAAVFQWFRIDKLSFNLRADAAQQLARPGYMEEHFYANHFRWEQTFVKTVNSRLAFSLNTKNTRLEAALYRSQNPIYFGTDTLPHQSDSTVSYFRAGVRNIFRLGPVYFDNSLYYQKVMEGSFIRVPELIAKLSWYVHESLFRHHLDARAGIDMYYNSSYYSYSYMPELSKFYVQNTMQTGNYPVIDVWLSGGIQRFRFFVKEEHVTQGLFGDKYYLLPHYPMTPRTLRFGIRWMFFN